MKKNIQILLSWLVMAVALVTTFSSCAVDNPLPPFDDGGGPYAFKDEMDPTVKPGDDFYNYVLGTWLKENQCQSRFRSQHNLNEGETRVDR